MTVSAKKLIKSVWVGLKGELRNSGSTLRACPVSLKHLSLKATSVLLKCHVDSNCIIDLYNDSRQLGIPQYVKQKRLTQREHKPILILNLLNTFIIPENAKKVKPSRVMGHITIFVLQRLLESLRHIPLAWALRRQQAQVLPSFKKYGEETCN